MQKIEGIRRTRAEIDDAIDAAFAKVFGKNWQTVNHGPSLERFAPPVVNPGSGRGRRKDTAKIQQIFELRSQGMSRARIAKRLDMTLAAVNGVFYRNKRTAAWDTFMVIPPAGYIAVPETVTVDEGDIGLIIVVPEGLS